LKKYLKIKKELFTLLSSNPEQVILISQNKETKLKDFKERILKTITYLKKNYKKKKIIYSGSKTEEFFVFLLACIFSNYKIFPIDPKTSKAKIASYKKKFKFDYCVSNFDLKKIDNEHLGDVNYEDAEFLYILSSGTGDGEPRAILHTISSLLKSSKSFSEITNYNEKTIVFHCLPTFYMAGILNTFLSCIYSNSKIAIGKTVGFENINLFWKQTKKLRVNSIHLTPSIFLALCIFHKVDRNIRDHLSEYQSIISTASYLYPEIRKKFSNIFKRKIQSCYGLTELGGPLTCENIEDTLNEDNDYVVGRHSNEVKFKISNNKTILIKSPFIMKGYVDQQGKVKKPRAIKGYFNTGDLGDYKDGILEYFGRNKEIIKIGGELVSLTIIENEAIKSNLIKECAAIGIANIYSGEDLILFVIFKKKNLKLNLNKLNKFLNQNLRKIEIPKKIIPVLEMPKTKSGKIIKKRLKDLYTITNA
jgi:acyl-CoA synthetase (AMP-forming)/AMP-acid ligase II